MPTASEERQCPWWKFCQCSHDECWGGFLNEDVVVVRDGFPYRFVARCPFCADAKARAVEAVEMEPEVEQHRRGQGRRWR